MYVIDVAAAIIAALKDDGTSMGKVYELGGPEVFTMHQLVIFLSFFIIFFYVCVCVFVCALLFKLLLSEKTRFD